MAMAVALNNPDLVNICTPSTWQGMSSEMLLYDLPQESEEFNSVRRQIHSTLTVHVKSVIRVQNPYLWGSYQLKKMEYKAKNISVREIQMFHCTAESNIDSIATNNLDWRRSTRSKFGQGVSFSPSAEYANKYANFNIGTDRALILTSVLVGRETQGYESMKFPPKLYDTSFGNRNRNGTLVYVKYCDHEFYPKYVAYYTCVNVHRPKFRRFSFGFDNSDYSDDSDGFYDSDF
ncbi:hypothetical protein R5R35_003224 [Gryllus longicercus]|uniref:Poly [ADP-ribose] polymerase n=1 Tax=Gryllus longicercus TaxID=2509291 RepID=A0AAN9VKN7_9ORTH